MRGAAGEVAVPVADDRRRLFLAEPSQWRFLTLGIAYAGSQRRVADFAYPPAIARTAHARAVKEIDPSVVIGRRLRTRSRRRALLASSSDIA